MMMPTTDIICKFFLDAVENSKYGWFWDCPNGPTCHYRHALPPGFVLSKDKKRLKELEKENTITLEELIEEERRKLDSMKCTKVTLESFLAWKKKKRKEKKDNEAKALEQKRKEFRMGRSVGISGREMFDFDPTLIAHEGDYEEGEATFDTSLFKREEDGIEETENFKEIDLAALTLDDIDEDDKTADGAAAGAVGGPIDMIDESLFDADALGLDDDDDELEDAD
jgi:ssDNA-binding Zn-finger/Zn-ribbon topoisomerase 1